MNLSRIAKPLACLPAFAALLGAAPALATSVACGTSGQTITAAINALPPSIFYQTIDVSGKCVETVYIPPAVAISLVGASGTSLTAASAGATALNIGGGKLQVTNINIATGTGSAIAVYQAGHLQFVGGTITGAGTAINVSDSGSALMQNTVISTTGNVAINVNTSGSFELDGVAGLLGRNGSTVTDSGGNGIFCNSGHVELQTQYSGGTITFTGNGSTGTGDGLYAMGGCSVDVNGSTEHPIIIEKTGKSGQYSTAIGIIGGTLTINGLRVIDNTDFGISVGLNASVQIGGLGTEITGNAGPAFQANESAVVYINGLNTISNPTANTNPLFNCYQGGKIYVDQIANTITPAPTSADIGCLTVGGP